jgi:hypothetical protein
MTRRVIKNGCSFEACREVRPSMVRVFESGAVLNMLQEVNPESGRFTIEGEGAEVWCCAHRLIEAYTDLPRAQT